MLGLWAGFGLPLLCRGEGLGFFGGFTCWPVCGVWFNVGSLLCSGCCLLLILGGKAFAIFPVFPGFGGACPVGLFCLSLVCWVPKLGWLVPRVWAIVYSLCYCIWLFVSS